MEKIFSVSCKDIQTVELTLTMEGVEFERKGVVFSCPELDDATYSFLQQDVTSINEVNEEIKASVKSKEIFHKQFDRIVKLVTSYKKRKCIYLHGPAGTGKSHIVKQLADFLGLDFYPESTLLSQYDLTSFENVKSEYKPSMFYMAYKFGGVFFPDEFDACSPDVPIKLNGALANGWFKFPNGEVVKMHKDFICICAGNTVGLGATEQYVGRCKMDAATLNRFTRIFIDYDENVEMLIAKGDREMVEFVHDFRNAIRLNHVNHICSYRELENLADFVTNFPLDEAIQMALSADEWCLGVQNMRGIGNMLRDKDNKYAKEYLKLAGLI